jgi:hypothetical protein
MLVRFPPAYKPLLLHLLQNGHPFLCKLTPGIRPNSIYCSMVSTLISPTLRALVRTRPERTAPYLLLHFGKALKHEASGGSFQGMSDRCRSQSRGSTQKQRDMILLDVESTYRPGVYFTNPAEFLLDKRSDLPDQDACAIVGTPDKVIG